MKIEEQLEKIKTLLSELNVNFEYLVIQDETHDNKKETEYVGLVDIKITTKK